MLGFLQAEWAYGLYARTRMASDLKAVAHGILTAILAGKR